MPVEKMGEESKQEANDKASSHHSVDSETAAASRMVPELVSNVTLQLQQKSIADYQAAIGPAAKEEAFKKFTRATKAHCEAKHQQGLQNPTYVAFISFLAEGEKRRKKELRKADNGGLPTNCRIVVKT